MYIYIYIYQPRPCNVFSCIIRVFYYIKTKCVKYAYFIVGIVGSNVLSNIELNNERVATDRTSQRISRLMIVHTGQCCP